MSVYYNLGTGLAHVCFGLFSRKLVEGAENVPPYGPLIVVSNHLGDADIPLITTSVPRQVHFMAKESLFKNRIAASILRGMGAFPLKRDGRDYEAARWTLDLLNHNQCVGIFPEGTRSLGEGMRKASVGTAYLAVKSQAPIVPVAICGSEKVVPMWRTAFPFVSLHIRIGQPFTLPHMEGKLQRPLLEHLTDMVMDRVAMMLPEGYRGYYGSKIKTGSHS